jgi:hypothetical protein
MVPAEKQLWCHSKHKEFRLKTLAIAKRALPSCPEKQRTGEQLANVHALHLSLRYRESI